MSTTDWAAQRHTAIHLLHSGQTPAAVAEQLGRPLAWVYKWRRRFAEAGWAGVAERARTPHHSPQRLSHPLREAIVAARSALEGAATQPDALHYIGAGAIAARLRGQGLNPPSRASIERVLAAAGLTQPRRCPSVAQTHYPHLAVSQPQALCQVDIVPRFLVGGVSVACFNAIDVVSHRPTGWASPTKRAADAVTFLCQVWHTLGIPRYTQVDNEACFSGGVTHVGVLGQVVRLALLVETQLVFSPYRHPQSNGTVERFHQDYVEHVWDSMPLADVEAVNQQGTWFFDAYSTACHQTALGGQSPQAAHGPLRRRLPTGWQAPAGKLPLTAGVVHFMRQVGADRTIRVLNRAWAVSAARPRQGVWASLSLSVNDTTLRVYDAAPDAATRHCLAAHVFPLTEPIRPRSAVALGSATRDGLLVNVTPAHFAALRQACAA